MKRLRLGVIITVSWGLMQVMFGAHSAGAQDGIDGMRLLGRNEIEFAHMMDFHLVGDYAYASVGLGAGLQTYDVSDPFSPGRITAEGFSAWRAWAHGDTIYSFCHARGVQLFDISGGAAVFLSGYNPPDAAVSYEGGAQVGDSLFVAAHQLGLHILNVAPPGPPFFVDEIPLTDNACWNVVCSGNHLFVANGRFGMTVMELTPSPVEVASLELPGLANDIVIRGDHAFLSLGGDGVAAVDITDPSNPILLDQAPTLGNAFGLGLQGDVLGVGSYPYVERFDVSDPGSISRAGWDASLVYAMGADVGEISNGDTVIVVADWRGMAVYAPSPEPVPDIDVFPMRLDFGAVPTGAPRDTTVLVRNTGGGMLDVTSIEPPPDIAVEPASFTLGPGETQPVTVTAFGPFPVWNRIRYNSNDPDESQVRQQVYASNFTFPQVGSIAPEFTLLGTDGSMHSLSDYLGKVVYLEFGASW